MNREEIFKLIIHHVHEVIPGLADHTFRPQDRLQDLGANSVDRAEIVMLVLESLSLNIPLVELFGPNNIGELADLLHEKASAA
jgi:polyketide biosynthesis acyl carrier protein